MIDYREKNHSMTAVDLSYKRYEAEKLGSRGSMVVKRYTTEDDIHVTVDMRKRTPRKYKRYLGNGRMNAFVKSDPQVSILVSNLSSAGVRIACGTEFTIGAVMDIKFCISIGSREKFSDKLTFERKVVVLSSDEKEGMYFTSMKFEGETNGDLDRILPFLELKEV